MNKIDQKRENEKRILKVMIDIGCHWHTAP